MGELTQPFFRPFSGDAFLNVLDKYTNLGIYIITHTFTLAELFTVGAPSPVPNHSAAPPQTLGAVARILLSSRHLNSFDSTDRPCRCLDST